MRAPSPAASALLRHSQGRAPRGTGMAPPLLQPAAGQGQGQAKEESSPGTGLAACLRLLCAPETALSASVRARLCCPPLAALSPRSTTGLQGVPKCLGKTLTVLTTLYQKLHVCRNADVKLHLCTSEAISPRAPGARPWVIQPEVELTSLIVAQHFLVTAAATSQLKGPEGAHLSLSWAKQAGPSGSSDLNKPPSNDAKRSVVFCGKSVPKPTGPLGDGSHSGMSQQLLHRSPGHAEPLLLLGRGLPS